MSNIKVVCPHCEEEFSMPLSTVGKIAECSSCTNSFTVKRQDPQKKTNMGKVAFLLTIVFLGTVLPFFLAGKEEIKKAILEKKKEVFAGPGFLLHVQDRARYEESPFESPDQWTYAPIAKTYPNIAGVYPLFAGNASLDGEKIFYNSANDSLDSWTGMVYTASWKLAPAAYSGEYDVYVRYGSTPEQVTNSFRLTIAGQKVHTLIQNTGGKNRFTRQKMGTVKLKKGQSYEAKIKATFIEEETSVCYLNAIEIVPKESDFRWFDTARNEWSNSIPRSLRLSSKTTDQRPPVQFIKGGSKSYAIITTLAFKKHSKFLKEFISHKESLGYTVHLITDLEFGGGEGQQAAKNIRQLLNQNYKENKILFALMIGNPDPKSGDIPMGLIDGTPTDLVYADCSQQTEDFSYSNFNAEKGLDGAWDVLVGRIPYYGEESAKSKASDVDEILKRTVAYEQASPEEILDRYKFSPEGHVIDAYFVEFTAFPYQVNDELSKSYLNESSIIENKSTPMIESLKGGLKSAEPGQSDNASYLDLLNGGIANVGVTIKTESEAGSSYGIKPKTFFNNYRTVLLRGHSIAQAYWSNLSKAQSIPNKSDLATVLYGDPSLTPFPEALSPRRFMAVRPVNDLEYFEPIKVEAHVKLHKQDYDLQNLSSKTQNWSVSSDVAWLEIKGKSQGEVKAGEIVTIETVFNKKARALSSGEHTAKLTIKLGEQSLTRQLVFKRYKEEVELKKGFDDLEGKVLSLDAESELLIEKGKLVKPLNRTLSFNIKAEDFSSLSSLIVGQGFELSVDKEKQSLILKASAYPFADSPKNNPYISFSTKDSSITLSGKTQLESAKWLSVAVSFNYTEKVLNLYLDGKIEASEKLPPYYFAIDGLSTASSLKAELDDLQVKRGVSSLKELQKLANEAKSKN